MQFSEFTRRLEKAHLSNEAMFLLSHMFEVQMEFSKALDLTLELMNSLADKLHRATVINKGMMDQIKALQQRDVMDGVSVRSEPYEEN